MTRSEDFLNCVRCKTWPPICGLFFELSYYERTLAKSNYRIIFIGSRLIPKPGRRHANRRYNKFEINFEYQKNIISIFSHG